MKYFTLLALLISSAYAYSTGSRIEEDAFKFYFDKVVDGQDISLEEWNHIKKVVIEEGVERDGVIELDLTRITSLSFRVLQALIVRSGFDPLSLWDQSVEIPGSNMNLANGSLEGLSTLGVSDPVIARLTLRTGILDITFPLAFEKLLIQYDYSTRVGLISASGDIKALVTEFRLNLRFGFDFGTLYAFVDDADIRDTGSIDIEITGLGHLEHIADLITSVIETYFQQIIIEAINLIIQIPIQRVVNSINESIDEALGRNSTEILFN